MTENDPPEAGNVSTPLPIRFSYLKALGRSPAHCKLAMDTDRLRLEEKPSPAVERGTAVHHLVFGTGKVIGYAEGKQRRGKEWEAFQEANQVAMILTASDYETVSYMATAVGENEHAMELIAVRNGSVYEQTYLWQHGERECRGTPDVVSYSYLVDLKSCENAEPGAFAWACRKYAYHAQMAWYMDGMNNWNGEDNFINRAYIVAVESKPPYPVTVLKLTDRALELGRRQYTLWLERFLACEQSGQWPGYVQSVVDLDVPEDETELVFEEDGE